jgi:hypothetical protein
VGGVNEMIRHTSHRRRFVREDWWVSDAAVRAPLLVPARTQRGMAGPHTCRLEASTAFSPTVVEHVEPQLKNGQLKRNVPGVSGRLRMTTNVRVDLRLCRWRRTAADEGFLNLLRTSCGSRSRQLF